MHRERDFLDVARSGRVEELRVFMKDNPSLNVNRRESWSSSTALHRACDWGRKGVVKLLLAHPDIDVNVKNKAGETPLSLGCESGKVSVVQLLLKDPRVDVASVDKNDCTPLWTASYCGRLKVVEWLIASGRDLGDVNKKGKYHGGNRCTALQIARKMRNTEIEALLARFTAIPLRLVTKFE